MSRYEIARYSPGKRKKKEIKSEKAQKARPRVVVDRPHVIREIQKTDNVFRAPDIDGISTTSRGRTLGIASPGGYRIYIPLRNLNARLIETDRGVEFAVRLSYREADALMRDIENATGSF